MAGRSWRSDRDEQRKLIQYNHLVANCLIFYDVCNMTQRLHKMRKEGLIVNPETLSRLSPYHAAYQPVW